MIKQEDLKGMSMGERRLVVLEALLRRITLLELPFVLKGSLCTRQYLAHPELRHVDDLDFLYLNPIHSVPQARETFTKWMIKATELDLEDGIQFRNFRKNAFWRDIDYAMDDDFPTINTDIAYRFSVEDRAFQSQFDQEVNVDVSFNLVLVTAPVQLEYRPVFGDPFTIPYTIPLSVQIAWKLHQTIVRPRFKDLYDLMYLLSHPSYNNQALQETLQTLVDECAMDSSITKDRIRDLLVGDLHHLYPLLKHDYFLKNYAKNKEPRTYFRSIVGELRWIMDRVGLNEQAYEELPLPSYTNW